MEVKSCEDASEKLTILQAGIAALFRDVSSTRDSYKSEIDGLKNQVGILSTQVERLDVENSRLKQQVDCPTCCKLQKKLTLAEQTLAKVQKNWASLRQFMNNLAGDGSTNNLFDLVTQKLFVEVPVATDDVTVTEVVKKESGRTNDVTVTEVVKKESGRTNELEGDTQFFKEFAEELDRSELPVHVKPKGNSKRKSEEILEELFGSNPGNVQDEDCKAKEEGKTTPTQCLERDRVLVAETNVVEFTEARIGGVIPETVVESQFQITNERTPEKTRVSPITNSPVFKKASVNRKPSGSVKENIEVELMGLACSSPDILSSPIRPVETRLLLKPIQMSQSNQATPPQLKRTHSQLCVRTPPKPRPSLNSARDSPWVRPRRRRASKPRPLFSPGPASKRSKTPLKRSPQGRRTGRSTPGKSSPGRRVESRRSPVKRRLPQLKASHSLEAELSIAGVRKLKQTVLNADCFKTTKPNQEKMEEKKMRRKIGDDADVDDECVRYAISLSLQDAVGSLEDDDVILESPNGSQQRSIPCKNEGKFRYDPDETLLSASLQDRIKPHASYHRLPDDEDEPQFAYQRGPVRKRSDRMKLPGQECLDCAKYFQLKYGNDMNPEEYKKLLNKCSRHRDRFPDISNTPPGYWKPYLSATISTTQQEPS